MTQNHKTFLLLKSAKSTLFYSFSIWKHLFIFFLSKDSFIWLTDWTNILSSYHVPGIKLDAENIYMERALQKNQVAIGKKYAITKM